MATARQPQTQSLETALSAYVRTLEGRNRSSATILAYRTDIGQFIAWLRETNLTIETPDDVERLDVTEYLAHLASRGLSGVSRARKLAAIREYFKYSKIEGLIDASPVEGIDTPKTEKRGRNYLSPEEYSRLRVAAGTNTRDYCILMTVLQTGVRVSELCALRLDDVDLDNKTLHVRLGKGMSARTIDLEKKGVQSIKSWLKVRQKVADDRLFLNRDEEPLGERGVQKLLAKYCALAGITKRISPHSLRHTFASHKAEAGVSPFQLQQWLGHSSLDTTQIYVHLTRKSAKKVMEATSL
ncbi:MAG: tyrosine-type recombinase/integrase [Thermomicrobiales bacterium]